MVLLPVSPRPSPIRGALFATNPSISLLFPTVLRKERPKLDPLATHRASHGHTPPEQAADFPLRGRLPGNPALNPQNSSLWVVGLRARLAL